MRKFFLRLVTSHAIKMAAGLTVAMIVLEGVMEKFSTPNTVLYQVLVGLAILAGFGALFCVTFGFNSERR